MACWSGLVPAFRLYIPVFTSSGGFSGLRLPSDLFFLSHVLALLFCRGDIVAQGEWILSGEFRLSRFGGVDTSYEAVIRTQSGDAVEIPWDFARHFGDAEYRDRMEEEAMRGRRKFAERLRRLRREVDMSQQRLADLSGVGRVTIARIEGAAQSPKLDTIQKLATGMGYPVQVLLMDDWADFANDGAR